MRRYIIAHGNRHTNSVVVIHTKMDQYMFSWPAIDPNITYSRKGVYMYYCRPAGDI